MAVDDGLDRLRSTLQPWGAPVESLLPGWRAFAQANNLTLGDLATGADDYFSQITSPETNSSWWGSNAWYRVPLQGAAIRRPDLNWSAWLDPSREASEQKALGVRLMAAQDDGDDGFGGLAALAAIAGIVTGGLSLIGSLGSAAVGAAGASLAEIAGVAALDAGFVGAAGASAISASGIGAGAAGLGATLGSIASVARPAFSVASGINTLTGGSSSSTPPPSQILNRNTPTMANPFYVIATASDTAQQQGAAPATVGKTPPPAALGMGMSGNTLALLAVAAMAWYAFSADKG
jgi:hypothetical protein